MAQISYYTTKAHRNATASAATTPATGNKVNVVDQNLDTIWSPPDATAYVTIDCGADTTVGIDAVGIWITNYDTDFSSATLTINADNSTPPTTNRGSSTIDHDSGPLFYFDLAAEHAYRYWQFAFTSLPATNIQIGQMFLLKKRTIQTTAEFPVTDEETFFNDVATMNGGRQYVNIQAGNYITVYTHRYTFISDSNRDAYRNAFIDSNGRARPFIYRPDTDVIDDSAVCRFEQDKPNIQEIDFDYYKAQAKFRTLPYIEAGEVV